MKQTLKTSLIMLTKNWPTLLLFEISYKLLSFTVIYSCIEALIGLILKTIQAPYISFENIYLIVKSPFAVLLTAAICAMVTFTIIYEIMALILYCEKGWSNENISLWQLLKQAFLKCLKLCTPRRLAAFSGFMLIIPLTVFPLSNNLMEEIKIPEFISEYIRQNRGLFILFLLTLILLNYLFILYLLGMASMFTDHTGFKASWKAGQSLLKKRKIKTLLRLGAAAAIYAAAAAGAAICGIIFLASYIKIFYPGEGAVEMFRFSFENWKRAGMFLAASFTSPWLIAVILSLFHEYRGEMRPVRPKTRITPVRLMKNWGMAIAAIIVLGIYSETELGGNFIYRSLNPPQIVAHRAGALSAPENTIAALDKAISQKASMAEIDVQQLRDGTLIIMHDSSFKRTTGVNKKVWEADYSDAAKYDAGSFYSPAYANEPVPTLEDMLKSAKGKINLMIELKSTGHEQNLEEKTLELIRKYDMLDQCNIASMNLDILERVKELEPEIETVYITPLLVATDIRSNSVDSYSVETSSLTKTIVLGLHFQGKKVYAWTANSKQTIQKNLRLEVDGLITDNPELVRFYIETKGTDYLADALVKLLF